MLGVPVAPKSERDLKPEPKLPGTGIPISNASECFRGTMRSFVLRLGVDVQGNGFGSLRGCALELA